MHKHRWINLREADKSKNAANSHAHVDNTSGYKGVKLRWNSDTWVSRIHVKGNEVFLGYFLTKDEAALAYNGAAKKYFGEYAKLNKIVK